MDYRCHGIEMVIGGDGDEGDDDSDDDDAIDIDVIDDVVDGNTCVVDLWFVCI